MKQVSLEKHFEKFRSNIIGIDKQFKTPFGKKKILYADWIASGRLYGPIEQAIIGKFGPFVGNTHSESSETGKAMTIAYLLAKKMIKKHVNANDTDVIITAGSGMTAVVNKFQRMLGLRNCGKLMDKTCIQNIEKPVVFITHMEHHSNHTSWYETNADVVIIEPDKYLLVDPEKLRIQLEKYKDRKMKIGSFSACSNVTGIVPPYYEMALLMHQYGGYCFIDFAASAPYIDIDMHPADPMKKLDAIFFSPHKFLGGPASSGVLIFDSTIYKNTHPDQPGGGTVKWTNRWGQYKFINDIEQREDGGTPGFIQAIRTALCIELKNIMGTGAMKKREEEILKIFFKELPKIKKLHILADKVEDRLGIISFYIEKIHYNLIVKILNDRFGIQVRGGCACAGTYGHFLLNVSYDRSKHITNKIDKGDLSEKPGWVRISIHPTTTNKEVYYIIDAIKQISENNRAWKKDYKYSNKTNEFSSIVTEYKQEETIAKWFELQENKSLTKKTK